MERSTLAEQILKIAEDLEFGLRPVIAAAELRKLAQIVQPGAGIPPSNTDEVARWNVTHERLDALELEMKRMREALQRVSHAGDVLKRLTSV